MAICVSDKAGERILVSKFTVSQKNAIFCVGPAAKLGW